MPGLPERYRLVRRIAAGGMATVWCAEDVILGRSVAVKLLADQFTDDPHAVRRFKREARTAARVSSHPNIVTIFDVGQTVVSADGDPPRPFIVMEHLPGGSAADALRIGHVSREDALRWIRDAASALDYAHRHGVVHRDIKPANMLIGRSRALHVADFGIARIQSEDTITHAGALFGTAAYLPPEQARGEPATEASDRYALAVVAFELLTGERPFKGEHFAAQAHAHAELPPPAASEVGRSLPPAVDQVLARGLAKTPSERWTSAGEFADAVEAAMRSVRQRRPAGPPADPPLVASRRRRPVSPPPLPPHLSLRSGASRRQARAIALGALAAVLAAVAIAAAANSGSGPASSRTPVKRTAAQPRGAPTAATRARRAHHAAATAATSTPPASSSSIAGSQGTTPAAATAPSSPSPSSSASGLEARGHQLLNAGSYSTAIPVLRQAVAAAAPSSLTYAYALYDLGHALRLGGDPAAAVPILRQRLRIPNQTNVVRAELDRALAQLGKA